MKQIQPNYVSSKSVEKETERAIYYAVCTKTQNTFVWVPKTIETEKVDDFISDKLKESEEMKYEVIFETPKAYQIAWKGNKFWIAKSTWVKIGKDNQKLLWYFNKQITK